MFLSQEVNFPWVIYKQFSNQDFFGNSVLYLHPTEYKEKNGLIELGYVSEKRWIIEWIVQ